MATEIEIRDVIGNLFDPSDLLSRIVSGVRSFVPHADGVAVDLLDEDSGLTCVSAWGLLGEFVGARLNVAASLSGTTVASGAPVLCGDMAVDGRADRLAARRMGFRSMVCLPLVHEGRAIGVLKAVGVSRDTFTEDDIEALAPLAGFVATLVKTAADVTRVVAETLGNQPGNGTGGTPSGPLATFVAGVLRPDLATTVATRQRIQAVLADRAFSMVYQPIVRLDSGRPAAVEALARFTGQPTATPDAWFADAHTVGLGVELELAAVAAGLTAVGSLPESVAVAVNAGPTTICTARFHDLVKRAGPARVVVELTEHEHIDDYRTLGAAITALRGEGARLSVDDTGAGYSSLTHILNLAPDVIKLDLALTRGIDVDPVRRSLAAALVTFSHESGAVLVAEGIETAGELATLEGLGVQYGQGYHLGRPAPLSEVPFSSPRVPVTP